MTRLRRRDWILIGLLLGSSLVCVRLGFWQLDRLEQRIKRNQQIEAQVGLPPRVFSSDLEDYTPVILEGAFQEEHQIVLQNRARDEVAGFHLVSPLQTADGVTVLIDRGWIPYENGAEFSLEAYRTPEAVTIEGVLLPSGSQPRWTFLADPIPQPGEAPLKSWRILDIAGLQAQMPYALHGQYIALRKIHTEQAAQPIPDFQPDLSNGPHLSYAIQWFSFAAIALIGGVVIMRKRIRRV